MVDSGGRGWRYQFSDFHAGGDLHVLIGEVDWGGRLWGTCMVYGSHWQFSTSLRALVCSVVIAEQWTVVVAGGDC